MRLIGNRDNDKKYRYIYYFSIVLSFLYLLHMSWMRWGDILIDTFTWNFYVPLKILNGAVLYKDIYDNVGILPTYLIAILFKLFGGNNYTIIYLGVFITLTCSFMLYKLTRFHLNRLFATLVSINFLFMFAFNNRSITGIFNFIMPYRTSSTLFFMFILASTLFFEYFIYSEKTKYLLFWSLALWFALMSRIEIAMTVWFGFLLLWVCWLYKKRPITRYLLYLILPIIMTILSYSAFLYYNDAFWGFKRGIIDFIVTNIKFNTAYSKLIAGYDKPWENISDILKSAIFQTLMLSVLLPVSNMMYDYYERYKRNYVVRFIIIVLLLLYAFIIGQISLSFIAPIQYKMLGIIFVGGIIAYLCLFIKADTYNKKYLMLLTIILIAFILTIRIILKYVPNGYGFYLLPMGLISYYIFYIGIFPSLYNKLLNVRRTDLRFYYIAVIIILIQLSLPFCYKSYRYYKSRTIAVVTVLGRFNFPDMDRTHKVLQMAKYLTDNAPEASSVVVFPEGVSLNVISKKDNPLPYYSFLPMDLKTIGEVEIIGRLSKEKIDYIAVLSSDTAEYGYDNFKSYAKELYAWIVNNYTLDAVAATPLDRENVENIRSYSFNDAESIEKIMQNNYKAGDFTILLFRRK
ncbi:MAG: hypothetical protein HQK99_08210 [Nitrospirae bacterium]|nr:hypothetical protein [Nitrospirota bacterium]